MNNPDKLATYGTQYKDKQNKNTTQYVTDTTMHKQTQTRHRPSYKQLDVKMIRTSLFSRYCNRHHNAELRT
jgi:hypothetical protein